MLCTLFPLFYLHCKNSKKYMYSFQGFVSASSYGWHDLTVSVFSRLIVVLAYCIISAKFQTIAHAPDITRKWCSIIIPRTYYSSRIAPDITIDYSLVTCTVGTCSFSNMLIKFGYPGLYGYKVRFTRLVL